MPARSLSEKVKRSALALIAEGVSQREIARQLGIGQGSVSKVKAEGAGDAAPVKTQEPEINESIRKALKRGPSSADALADALDCGPSKIRKTIDEMMARGATIFINPAGEYDLAPIAMLDKQTHEVKGTSDAWTHQFGITTDNHLCNKHSRLDVLNAAYERFEREGIATVYNCGNWVDGEARFNKTELVTAPGMDNQLDYMIDKWPVKKGIATHFIAGDDHEGWYSQREGIEVGRYLQYRAEDQGRKDLKYLGYAEADVRLKHGTGSATMRLVHPGGGSAYAISYTDQKRVESYQGGEKPQIELAGHYHKWNHGYPREVHTVQCGCTCDQSLFMRKKRLQAHVGFVIVRIKQDSEGIVTRFAAEWFPYFDRKFYEHRF